MSVEKEIETVKNFCMIQLEVLKDTETKLRKELLNCKMQQEFLSQTLQNLGGTGAPEK